MKIIDVYVAWTTTDEYGRQGQIIGIYTEKRNALLASTGNGWYGGDGKVEGRKAIVTDGGLGDGVYLIDVELTDPIKLNINLPELQKSLRKIALSKLSVADKEVLGLDGEED